MQLERAREEREAKTLKARCETTEREARERTLDACGWWMQCEACAKWRRFAIAQRPQYAERWTCELAEGAASCDAPSASSPESTRAESDPWFTPMRIARFSSFA